MGSRHAFMSTTRKWLILGVLVLVAGLLTGAAWRLAMLLGSKRVPILMYHRLGPNRMDMWTVREEDFTEQMRQLKERGYQTILPSDLVAATRGERRLPPHPFIITFDDGSTSIREIALPILKTNGFQAVSYIVPSATAGSTNERASLEGSQCLTWEEIKAMREEGTFTFGAHTLTHVHDEILKNPDREIGECRKAIQEKGGFPPDSFCFAYNEGAGNRGIAAKLAQSGFTTAMSVRDAVAKVNRHTDLLNLPRVWVRGGYHTYVVERQTAEDGTLRFRISHTGFELPVAPRLVWPGARAKDGWQSPRKAGEAPEVWTFRSPGKGIPDSGIRLEIWDAHRLFRLAAEN
jgi:peptidoglycan/xylan/chitin deacetylase (PgdA/CDA1 family)